MALARPSGSNLSRMMAFTPASTIDDPTPMNMREPMSCQRSTEIAQSPSAAEKSTKPSVYEKRRPPTSPSHPTVITMPTPVTQKATDTHNTVDVSVSNASASAG